MVIRGDQFAVWLCVLLQVKKCVSCLSTCIFPDKTTYPIDETMVSFVIVGSCVELLDTILNWWGLKISWLCLCISMAKEYKNYELWFFFIIFCSFYMCMYWNEPKPCVHVSLLSVVLYAKHTIRTCYDAMQRTLCVMAWCCRCVY